MIGRRFRETVIRGDQGDFAKVSSIESLHSIVPREIIAISRDSGRLFLFVSQSRSTTHAWENRNHRESSLKVWIVGYTIIDKVNVFIALINRRCDGRACWTTVPRSHPPPPAWTENRFFFLCVKSRSFRDARAQNGTRQLSFHFIYTLLLKFTSY